ncbi:MAG TPA: PadR family transcriptional regulator [Longimicrobiales bacterium]
MSLDHLLLGMLAEPAAGYDLKRMFGMTLRHFWDAELSQIYPTLARLERRGLLKSARVPSPKGPPRRVYRRTEAGTQALREWLEREPEIPQPRLGFLGQLTFLHELGDLRRTRQFVERIRAAFAARLAVLREVEALFFHHAPGWPDDLSDEDFHAHLTVRHGMLRIESALAWCDESLRRIDARLARARQETPR